MKFEIIPFVGVGEVKFGDTEVAIRRKIGNAERRIVESTGTVRLEYSEIGMHCYLENDTLSMLTVTRNNAGFCLFNIKLFSEAIFDEFKRRGLTINKEPSCTSFGDLLLHRVVELGLELAQEFDQEGGSRWACFCYPEKEWRKYLKGSG